MNIYIGKVLWVNDHGEEPLLPGLTDYNQRQMFWIRNAHQWCHKYTQSSLENALYGVHTPAPYRLVGSLMLSDEFAKDFQCPRGSFMNPAKNCSIGSIWPETPKGLTRMNKYAKRNNCERITSRILSIIIVLFEILFLYNL